MANVRIQLSILGFHAMTLLSHRHVDDALCGARKNLIVMRQ